MKSFLRLYARFSALVSYLQSPFLLAVRLYWGRQFAQSGWGKLHHLDKNQLSAVMRDRHNCQIHTCHQNNRKFGCFCRIPKTIPFPV
jgi:hypothetical protein